MKENLKLIKSSYWAIYRLMVLMTCLGLFSTQGCLTLTESFGSRFRFISSLQSAGGTAAVFIIALICETALIIGRKLDLYRIFFGAVLFMGLVSFIILMRWDLHIYIPGAFIAMALTALITGSKRRRLVTALILAGFGGYFMWQGELKRIFAAGLIFLLLLSAVEIMGRDINIWIPYCLILSLILLTVPVSKKPFDWSFVLRFINLAEKTFEETVNNISYQFGNLGWGSDGSGGYSGLGRIGSGVSEGTREELEIRGIFRGPAYLSGVSYKKRQKGRWTERAGSKLAYNGWFIQFLNLLYQNGVSKETARSFSEPETIRIGYRYLKTADVIHPVNTMLLEKTTRDEMTGDRGDYRYVRKKGKGNEYRLDYLALNSADPVLEEIIKRGTGGRMASYEELDGFCKTLYPFELSHYISRADYEAFLKNHGGELDDPVLLDTGKATERMRELAKELTIDKTDDLSKARAIEAYLRQFTYNRNADHSRDKDPVDGFLFENREGYCVHFASAMVDLLRLCGIRARYSEGYVISFNKGKNGNVTEVTSSSAHAWPEAYIEGIGWMVFEPTPVQPVPGSYGWESRGEKTEDIRDLSERYRSFETVSPAQVEPAEGEPERGFFERYGEAIKYTVYALLLLLLYFVAVFAVRILIRRLVYIKRDDSGKLMMNVADIKRLIEKNYFGDWDNAPLRDYEQVLEGELREDAGKVFEEYYRLRFAATKKPPAGTPEKTSEKSPTGVLKSRSGKTGVTEPPSARTGSEELRKKSEELKRSLSLIHRSRS